MTDRNLLLTWQSTAKLAAVMDSQPWFPTAAYRQACHPLCHVPTSLHTQLPGCLCLSLSHQNTVPDICQHHTQLLCRHGFAARYLIEQGADPFIQDRTFHRSAIHYAAAQGKADALRRLLDDNLRIHTEEGFVPLKAARIQDVSGNCRYCPADAPIPPSPRQNPLPPPATPCQHADLPCVSRLGRCCCALP